MEILANRQQRPQVEIWACQSARWATTIKEHYQILEDTLIGFTLNPWLNGKKRKSISTAKFYLFDTGVAHTLAQTQTLDRNSDLYGGSFEHWIAMELRSYLSYARNNDEVCFWRSTLKQEVDFVVGNHTAIEVKAAKKIDLRDTRGLRATSLRKQISAIFWWFHKTKLKKSTMAYAVFIGEPISATFGPERFADGVTEEKDRSDTIRTIPNQGHLPQWLMPGVGMTEDL